MLSNLWVFSSASVVSLSASLLSSARLGHLQRAKIKIMHAHTSVHSLEYSPPQQTLHQLSATYSILLWCTYNVHATKAFSPHCSLCMPTCMGCPPAQPSPSNLYGFTLYDHKQQTVHSSRLHSNSLLIKQTCGICMYIKPLCTYIHTDARWTSFKERSMCVVECRE